MLEMACRILGVVVNVICNVVCMLKGRPSIDEHAFDRFPAALAFFDLVGLVVDLAEDG